VLMLLHFVCFFIYGHATHRDLPSFPTRRSSDLDFPAIRAAHERIRAYIHRTPVLTSSRLDAASGASLFFKCENFQKDGAFKARGDRKSTRLNSSHVSISYAVFCLKKKKLDNNKC